MNKQQLYPKTKRVGKRVIVIVTEKLDGSNLGFFKYEGELYVAQRIYTYKVSEIFEDAKVKGMMYKGLYGWLEVHAKELGEELQDGACIFGEWLGMGKIKYTFTERWLQFAKCNVEYVDGAFRLKNLYYDSDLFKWSYVSQKQPYFISSVPLVCMSTSILSVTDLDKLFLTYTKAEGRDVEGFVVSFNSGITKYVRRKDGTLTEHKA